MPRKKLRDPRDFRDRVQETVRWFSTIYLGGIPPIITNDSAFLAFICIVTATEALSGYRYGGGNLSRRFEQFVREYFPDAYAPHAEGLYALRKKLVHAFSTGPFQLIHHRSDMHLRVTTRGEVILNAEDTYGALLSAAQKYFAELDAADDLKRQMVERLDEEGGGSIGVARIAVIR